MGLLFPLPSPLSPVRSGLTLLEVLIAIFVMAVGLMGLAALIPVGRHEVLEGGKSDRGAALGRAAFRDVKVRKMLSADLWMNCDSSDDPPSGTRPIALAGASQNWVDVTSTAGTQLLTPIASGGSICIDPLFIARADQLLGVGAESTQRGTFPYTLNNDPPMVGAGTLQQPRMTRVTLRAWPALTAPALGYAAADRIFRCQDDLVFNLNTDETKRADASWSDSRMQSMGDYTYVVTATPMAGNMFAVSTAVFYKRDLVPPADFTNAANRADSVPTERLVYANFLSGGVGFGGGDVRLRLLAPSATTSTPPEQSDFTPVRPNTWLMLCTWTNATPPQPIFHWYRVTSVGKRKDGQKGPEFMDNSITTTPSGGNEWYQDVTLSGPDIDGTNAAGTFLDADGVNTSFTVFAALFDNVVAVYTKTIAVDTLSGW